MKKQEWSHMVQPAKGAAAQSASVTWLPAAGCSQGTSVPPGSSGRCGSGYWSGAGLASAKGRASRKKSETLAPTFLSLPHLSSGFLR